MKKRYTSAPLPFQGQKRRFIGAFALALEELKQNQDVKVIVDLFGGSGLLSHTAKDIFPDCQVIYNDFDNYSVRLRNIDRTNRLLSDIRELAKDQESGKRIDPICSRKIITRVEHEEQTGFVDYVTLSASLLFSMSYVSNLYELKNATLYNRLKASDYICNQEEYLQGLDIVSQHYQELYLKYKDVPGVVFLLDPPYLSTDTGTYKSDKYWKLRDYLDVLNVLTGSNYVFFTSNKSNLIELCEWFEDNRDFRNPFKGSVLQTQKVTLNKTSGYTDMMLYKFKK